MDFIPIRKSTQTIEGRETEVFIVPAMKIKQGTKTRKIPHPNGDDRLIFLNEQEALEAVKKSGFLTPLGDFKTVNKETNYNGLDNIIFSIMALLKDTNQTVIASAIFALGEMKAVESIEPLIGFLDNANSTISQNSVEALAKIGAATVPALIKTLQDKSWEKRMSAAKCLGEMAQYKPQNLSQSITSLLLLLTDNNPVVKSTASLSLAKIYKSLNQENC